MDHLKECCICCEVYNEVKNRPLVLPCGHTLCKECVNNVTSGLWTAVVECPICRRKHTVNKNQLPTNFVVLELIRTTENTTQPNTSAIPESFKCEAQPSKSETNYPKSEEKKTKTQNSDGLSTKQKIGIGVGAVAGGTAAVLAAPVVLTGVGFTSAGIAASSWAASMMSAAAVANGGGVAAGSMVAVLQSAGAAGLSTGAAASVGAAGAAIGTGIAAGFAKLTGRRTSNTNSDSEKCADGKTSGKDGKDNKNNLKKEKSFDEKTLEKDSKVFFTKHQNNKEFEDSDDDLIKF